MTGTFPVTWPDRAAFCKKIGQSIMDVILHLGAHRTGTTTFQHYVRDHLGTLERNHIGFWGPGRTRKSVFPGLFHGMSPRARRRAEGRVRMLADRAEARGFEKLVVSDENMLGSCTTAFRNAMLYPAAGDRAAPSFRAQSQNGCASGPLTFTTSVSGNSTA